MLLLNTQHRDFSLQFDKILKRARLDIQGVEGIVKGILDSIRIDGDKALLEHILKFDDWNPQSFEDLKIPEDSMQQAYEKLDDKLRDALQEAHRRIFAFHQKQKPKTWLDFEENGTILGQKITPLDRVGLYIPGGKAAYPSSLLMNAIPALVAGVKEIVVCTPALHNEINPLLLAAMYLCGIKEAYKVGGASAVGMMAYGIGDRFKKVDMISGPGNIYVATAKKCVFGEVNVDMIAGPSEIGIIADCSARADYITWDLLSQAEHDEMASSILITTSAELASEVSQRINEFLPKLPRREIIAKSIYNRGAIIVTQSLEESIQLSNAIAPEHLELLLNNPLEVLPQIKHAGAIFIGENTPEPIGDYIAGPNHTLPTGGSAKFFSPLSTEHFMKKSSVIAFSKMAIDELGEKCGILARAEGLDAHKNSVLIRLNKKD
ncbi:histidinol dehydrogenase [Helicobacter mesocricetorum]|uniref:histidinol dehydrogenase n=1 Tax=Helicobacter mesocricetorum TaxID=87012 RepID=UPI000CF15F81|nr:histidinol dehydrogenase [Helicobacter mesocricetorum]